MSVCDANKILFALVQEFPLDVVSFAYKVFFLRLGLRSLLGLLMMHNIRPSKTLVGFFLFSLAPAC